MNEILTFLIQFLFVIVFGYGVFLSCVMVDEKKQRRRKGLTDYYDNPIKTNKCLGGEDDNVGNKSSV